MSLNKAMEFRNLDGYEIAYVSRLWSPFNGQEKYQESSLIAQDVSGDICIMRPLLDDDTR
jgi:hypothetical protein